MEWLIALFRDHSVAHTVLILSLAVSLGLALGNIKFFGISLGVGGVLFSGLLLGHFHFAIEPEILEFMREFGLILFVYAIGLQVGPGFFSSLRKQGLQLNLFAATNVIGGTLFALLIGYLAKLGTPTIVGVLSGAVTNTPSLGAAQQALKEIPSLVADAPQLASLGYAVAYPFGILGIISAMLVIKSLFRIDVAKEAEEFSKLQGVTANPVLTLDYNVSNPKVDGLTIAQISKLIGPGVVITRHYHGKKQTLATPETTVHIGDVLHAVGAKNKLEQFRSVVGEESTVKLQTLPSEICFRSVVVTKKKLVGKELGTLKLDEKYGVIITRIGRSGVEFTPTVGLKLQFGDRLMVVGTEQSIIQTSKQVGDSLKELETPHIIPIFVGIALGVIFGSIPLRFPGIPAPVKLGLAGGPLIVALVMARLGKVGPILSYMPSSAKMLLREFGIAIFLACVGLKAGERLWGTLRSGDGFLWMLCGAMITFIPLVIVGIVARAWKKMNFMTICGVLSGSMTDPPALAYSTQISGNDAPSIAYATVYPLTMLLRVVIAQLIVLLSLG